MAISKIMEKEFNKQINAELYSSYLYLSMAANFESTNLKGLATWMKVQAKEEMTHVMKMYDFVFDRGGKVLLDTIKKPKASWKTPLDAFKEALAHEKYITNLINNLVELTKKEKDNASFSFLQWFVNEQVEEEATAEEIVQRLSMIKGVGGGIYWIDRELGMRGRGK